MTRRQGELLLAGVILARSTSYLLTKTGLETMGPFTLLAIRFLLAFGLLLLLFGRRLRQAAPATFLRGLALGGAFFGTMTAELFSLSTTDTATVSFLENTAIVLVPVTQAFLLRRLPSGPVAGGAALSLAGVGLLTLGGGALSFTPGELWALAAAGFYTWAILLTDRLSKRDDPLLLGVLQVGALGLFSLAAAFVFETPRLPQGGGTWGMLLTLALVCTVFGFTLQPMAQRVVPAERAGLFCGLNPAMAAVLGTTVLHEHLGVWGVLGAVLVLAGLLVPPLAERAALPRKVFLSPRPRVS